MSVKRAKNLSKKIYTKLSHMVFRVDKHKSKARYTRDLEHVDKNDLTFEYFCQNDIWVKIARTLLAKLTQEELDEIIDDIKKARDEDRMNRFSRSYSSSKKLLKRKRSFGGSIENRPNTSQDQTSGKYSPMVVNMTTTSTEYMQTIQKRAKRKSKGREQEIRHTKSPESYTKSNNMSKKRKSRRTKSQRKVSMEIINGYLNQITDNLNQKMKSLSKNQKKKKSSGRDRSSSLDKGIIEQQDMKTLEIEQKPDEDIKDNDNTLEKSTHIRHGRHIVGSLGARRYYPASRRPRANERRRSTNDWVRNSRGDGERVTSGLYEDTGRARETVQKRFHTGSRPRRNRRRNLPSTRYQSRKTSSPTTDLQESVLLMSTIYDE